MTRSPIPASLVLDALHGRKYLYSNESRLHRGLAAALDAAEITYSHEVPVIGGRIDFVVGNLGIEVKINGSADAVARQLGRYTEDPQLSELLLITTRPTHRAIPRTINNTPIHVMTIGGLSL